jgi:hypothetical protein
MVLTLSARVTTAPRAMKLHVDGPALVLDSRMVGNLPPPIAGIQQLSFVNAPA